MSRFKDNWRTIEAGVAGWAYRLCKKYNQLDRVQEVKHEVIVVLLEKREEYDPTVGTSLLQFAARDMLNAVHDYLRKNVGMYLLSGKEYRNLRKANAIYYHDKWLSHNERIQAVMAETDFTQRQAENYIVTGWWFRYPGKLEPNTVDFEQAKLALDPYSNPADIVPRALLYDALVEQIEALRPRDRELLLDYLGIACLHCGQVQKRVPLSGLADKLQLRDEQSVARRVRKIAEELRKGLREQGWI